MIHLAVPGFYETVWRLAGSGDIIGAAEFCGRLNWAMVISFTSSRDFNTLGFLPNFFILAGQMESCSNYWRNNSLMGWRVRLVRLLVFGLCARLQRLCSFGNGSRCYLHQIEEFSSHKGFQTVLLTRLCLCACGTDHCRRSLKFVLASETIYLLRLSENCRRPGLEVMAGHDLADTKKHEPFDNKWLVMAAAYGLVCGKKRKRKAA